MSDAIRSALAQTWRNKEIIVVDDGSRDQTLAVARSFVPEGVKVHSQANQGASVARNRALADATGDFIQWLDADDILEPAKVETQLRVLAARPGISLLSSAWASFHYRPEKASFQPNALWKDLDPVSWLRTKMETNSWMAIQAWLVPRALTRVAGGWDTSLSADDDGEYFSRIVAASNGVRFVEQAKSFCRVANPRSLSRGYSSEKWVKSQFRALNLQIACLRRLDDGPSSRAAALLLLKRWFVYFYPNYPEMVADLQKLARELGGEISVPELRWKYKPIQYLFGWEAAKKAQFTFPTLKAWFKSELDRWAAKAGTGASSEFRAN